MKKVALVTGSKGFVGSHIADALYDAGWLVLGCDIIDGEDCREIFKTNDYYDLVVHCAAVVGGRMTIDHEPLKVATDLAIDSDFFQFIVRTHPARAIYFSSSAAYPIEWQNPTQWASSAMMIAAKNGGIVPLSERMIGRKAEEPDAIYGWVKLTGERLATLAQQQGVDVQVFRPFSGYGSDQDLDYPFPSFIQRALRRDDPFEIWGDGTQKRDWVHIDDIVTAAMESLHRPVTTPLNICTGIGTSMNDAARLVCDVAGYHPEFRYLIDRPVGVQIRVGDPTESHLFYKPMISLVDGVERALADDYHRVSSS